MTPRYISNNAMQHYQQGGFNITVRSKRILQLLTLVTVSTFLFNTAPSIAGQQSYHTVTFYGQIVTPTPSTMQLHVDGNKIKDANGNIIYLRGANYFHWKADQTEVWLTSSGTVVGTSNDWATQIVPAIIQNFDKMASFNLNCFRVHTCAQDWLQMPLYISHMQQLASLAAERGIYVIFEIYDVSNSSGYNQPHMWWPPYSEPGDELVIPNAQAFVDLWGTIANAMKNSPNVILELGNEPTGDGTDTSYQSWMNTVQACVTRIRQITDRLIIIPTWGWQVGYDLQWGFISPSKPFATVIDDPRYQGANVGYSFHWYEDNPQKAGQHINDAANITEYMSLSGIDDVASRKVVLATELGGVVGDSFSLTWMNNALDALYSRGIGGTSFAWCQYWHMYGLLTGGADFALTDKGTYFVQKTSSW